MNYLAAILLAGGFAMAASDDASAKSRKRNGNGNGHSASFERPEHSARRDGTPSDYRFNSRNSDREIRLFFARVSDYSGG